MTGLIAGASLVVGRALQLIESRTTAPRSIDVDKYVRQVTAHCPYLAPALSRGMVGWTVYRLTDEATGPEGRLAAEAGVFAAGVQAAEWLRPLIQRPQEAWRCENVVILGARTPTLLDWPHWALKHLYGPVGIMVGKFPAGERARDRADRDVPPPPVPFLPVRAAIRTRDPRFLAGSPELARTLAVAVDDGRDVFAHHRLSRVDWKEIRTWAAQRRLPAPNQPSPPHEPPAAAPSA